MEILEPDIERIEDQQREILKNQNLSTDLLDRLTVGQASAAYVVGILRGFTSPAERTSFQR